MKNIIVAHTHEHGAYFALNVMNFKRTETQIVTSRLEALLGISDCVVWILNAPRYSPTPEQFTNRQRARSMLQSQTHRIEIMEIDLP